MNMNYCKCPVKKVQSINTYAYGVAYNQKWRLGSLEGILGDIGPNSIIFKHRQNLRWFNHIQKWSSGSHGYEKVVLEVTRGHLTSIWGKLVVILGQNLKISKAWQILDRNEALGPVITNEWFLRAPEVTWL